MNSTRYEYVLCIQDKMTGVLKKVGAQGNKTFDDLQARQEKLNRTTGSLTSTMAKLGAGFGVFELGKKWLTAGADIESTRIAFTTFMKDANKANDLVNKLNKYADITPFENDEIIAAGRQLLSVGIAADKIIPKLGMIGDVASGAKIPITELTAIYAKVMNKGRVQAEELNQMSERGIPILQTLADMFKTNTAQIMKMGEKGQLTSEVITKAFEKLTSEGGLYYHSTDNLARSVQGKWSTMVGGIGKIFQKFGESTNNSVSRLLDKLISLTDWIGNNSDTILKWGKAALFVAGAVGVWKAATLAQLAVTKISLLWEGIQLASIGVLGNGFLTASVFQKIFAAGQWKLNAALSANPIGLVILGIVALIAAITYVISKTDGWRKTWEQTMTYIKLSFEQVGIWFELKWLQYQDKFLTGIDKIKIAWYKLKGLWNKDEAAKGLAEVRQEAAWRAQNILDDQQKLQSLSNARSMTKVWNVTWDKDKKLSDITGGLQGQLGLGGNTPGSGASDTVMGNDAGNMPTDIKDTAKGIADGGSRPTNVNITLSNLVETLTISPATMKEGTSELERMVKEALLRVLNSANGVAYGN
jgi:tape measure domain-containing protein